MRAVAPSSCWSWLRFGTLDDAVAPALAEMPSPTAANRNEPTNVVTYRTNRERGTFILVSFRAAWGNGNREHSDDRHGERTCKYLATSVVVACGTELDPEPLSLLNGNRTVLSYDVADIGEAQVDQKTEQA